MVLSITGNALILSAYHFNTALLTSQRLLPFLVLLRGQIHYFFKLPGEIGKFIKSRLKADASNGVICIAQ